MIGAISGDIVGSRFEFDVSRIKRKEFTPLFSKDCFYTDDTVMTCAVANALFEWDNMGRTSLVDLKSRVVSEMKRFGIEYQDAGYGGKFAAWLSSESTLPYYSFGNGSAMRVSGVARFASNLEEAEILAKVTAETTHNHPEGIRGAQAAAAAQFLAIQKKSKADIRKYIQSRYYDLDFTLDDIRPNYKFHVSCQESVPQAIVAFLEAESFEEALRNAVSLGGDTDTQATICGGIAEDFFGMPDDIAKSAYSYLPQNLANIAKKIDSMLNNKILNLANVKLYEFKICKEYTFRHSFNIYSKRNICAK